MTEPATVAFVGLGVMGYPMAGHLARAGHRMTVFNRTRARAEQWAREYGGTVASTPRAASAGARFLFVCVGNDDDVRAVTLGDDGALGGLEPGAVLVDHTTASPDLARELASVAADRNVGFLDAPVSGGQAGAERGALTIMAGGHPEAFERVQPIVSSYARSVTLMGPPGTGQMTKLVNQICIAGLLQALAEGLHFAEQSGLDAERVLDVIGGGAAQSWQMENRGRTMLAGEFDFGFAVDWMRKDLEIALHTARRHGVSLPVTGLVDQFYSDVQALGGGRWDTSSLIQRLRAARQRRSSGT